MLIECEDQRQCMVSFRVNDCLSDDLLVAEMHTIEETNRQANPLVAGVEFSRVVDEFHAASFKNGITRCSISRADSFSTSSNGRASATSNFPETMRRNFARCAPQPSFWPSSCAMLRT